MIDQEKIHNQCLSDNWEGCKEALDKLKDNFSSLSDKQQAWNDLIRLTTDEGSSVIYGAASALGSAFSDVPDKQQAWNDLHRLTFSEDRSVRLNVLEVMGIIYQSLPDKKEAWGDLHRLTSDTDIYVRREATSTLRNTYQHLPDKQKALEDLIKLNSDKNRKVRIGAAWALIAVFQHLPDKKQMWEDLRRLTSHENNDVRNNASWILGYVVSHVPDKQQAWNDLINLTTNENSSVRYGAASALGSLFSQIPDKQQAWSDLHRLTTDEDNSVRYGAASALGSAFSQIPDKQQTWNDLHRLTSDEDSYVRSMAASVLSSVFSNVPDKQQAWNDLHKLIINEKSDVRSGIVAALGSAFSDVPDKQQAWNDLHKLTSDKDGWVRANAASALGSAFYDLPDKQQSWNDLIKLTNDEDPDVIAYSNHSLGKVSILRASQSENEENYKEELKTAIVFFEKAAQITICNNNPSQFCLPFYRSFHAIVFKSKEAKEEVNKYLAEAKDAVKGSKSKELLFEAVENLANALKEVQNTENLDQEAKKGELNFYRQYCDRAEELLRNTEKTAPFATIALRKGLPILDRNLKRLIEEIQEKAKIACKEAKGTDTEEIACTINREIQRWEIGSQEEMAFNMENLIFTLEANTPHNLQNNFILDRIKQIPEQKDVAKQYGMLSSIITIIIKSSLEQKLHDIGEKVDQIGDKLEEITISLKPGISEELIIHVGPITQWGGIEYTMSIPLQDISYPELKEDLQKIMGKKIDKLSKMPAGLASKVRDYLIQKNMWNILDKLT